MFIKEINFPSLFFFKSMKILEPLLRKYELLNYICVIYISLLVDIRGIIKMASAIGLKVRVKYLLLPWHSIQTCACSVVCSCLHLTRKEVHSCVECVIVHVLWTTYATVSCLLWFVVAGYTKTILRIFRLEHNLTWWRKSDRAKLKSELLLQ